VERKAIFVTGAGSGIGRETALLFARRGWGVGAFDRAEGAIQAVAAEIGGDVCAGVLDVTDPAAYAQAVERFEKAFGRLDVLFNCAGVMQMGRLDEVPLAQHLLTVQVNAFGVVNGIHAALPLLKRTAGAHVISMGSASGFYGVPELAVYSASKFFVRGLTEALNLELEKDGIQVSDLMPSYVRTPMISGQARQVGSVQTMGASLTPADIAALVWTAAHGARVHWVPRLWLKALSWGAGAFPWTNRLVMRRIAKI
jgi:NADP-dependent 3-hydroxy acid dehydrogenase YdfG